MLRHPAARAPLVVDGGGAEREDGQEQGHVGLDNNVGLNIYLSKWITYFGYQIVNEIKSSFENIGLPTKISALKLDIPRYLDRGAGKVCVLASCTAQHTCIAG